MALGNFNPVQTAWEKINVQQCEKNRNHHLAYFHLSTCYPPSNLHNITPTWKIWMITFLILVIGGSLQVIHFLNPTSTSAWTAGYDQWHDPSVARWCSPAPVTGWVNVGGVVSPILTVYDNYYCGELARCNLSGLSGLVLTKENRSHRKMLRVQYQILEGFVNDRSASTWPVLCTFTLTSLRLRFGNPNNSWKDEEMSLE